MTISKALPAGDFAPVEFMDASKAQSYVSNLEKEISSLDGSPVYFVHDGSSGTSHDIMSQAEESYCQHDTVNGTLLWKLVEGCAETGATLRIWWASNIPNSHRAVVTCNSLSDFRNKLIAQIDGGKEIAIRFEFAG